ncbi:MAG: hypothetical protein GX432_01300 [Candidatus Atribacteria bacterium]|nr:hypothetical protein [Candidatus Atribacteria bacterium]
MKKILKVKMKVANYSLLYFQGKCSYCFAAAGVDKKAFPLTMTSPAKERGKKEIRSLPPGERKIINKASPMVGRGNNFPQNSSFIFPS